MDAPGRVDATEHGEIVDGKLRARERRVSRPRARRRGCKTIDVRRGASRARIRARASDASHPRTRCVDVPA